MKWIWLGVLAAWSGIIALAWWLADRRTGSECYRWGNRCDPALVAVRDYTLIVGLAVPLALFVALVIAGLIRTQRLNRRNYPSTTRKLVEHERNDRT